MTEKSEVDLTQDRLFSLGFGLVFRAVCAPGSWSAERVAEQATRDDPPGTSANIWVVSEPRERNDVFNGVNNIPCPDCTGRTHWLLNC